MDVTTAGAGAGERTLTDRLLAATPLLSVFLWLCIVFAVEAWAHTTPWLFGDELELTQLARSVAETGHAARRGDPHFINTLWTYVMAGGWLIHDTQRAYDTIKYLGVIAMALTVFPAYGIARTMVGKVPALFVAAASAAIPAVAYSAMIVEEPAAYPYSTFCLFLIVRSLISPTRGWIVGTLVASLIAPLVRGELVVIPVVWLLASLFLAWRSEWATRLRASWTLRDWLGLAALLSGAGVVVSAFLGHHSFQWLVATRLYKDRMLNLGLDAAGALTIGLGVLPVVVGLAMLWRAPGEQPSRATSVFRSVLLASLIAFGVYTAVKATYVSTTFGTYTYERNLIYLSPLFIAGTALWLERQRINPVALALSAGFVLALVLTTPYDMGHDIAYNAPGLAILQQANRVFALDPTGAKIGLLSILALSVALVVAPRFLRQRGTWLAMAVGVAVIGWNLTGELAFASASNRAADSFVKNIRRPFTWVDQRTGGAPTIYLGQQMKDQNGEWLLEFWNRSVKRVWSLDGTAQGPGAVLTPDIRVGTGVLFPDIGYPYVVEEGGIEVAGRVIASHLHVAGGRLVPWRLVRVSRPLRLLGAVTGIFPDGWSGENSSYTRYATAGGRAGRIKVIVSRQAWGGPDKVGHVTMTIGPIVLGIDKEPHVGTPAVTKRFDIHSRQRKVVTFDAPGPRFRVETTITPTFSPHELDPDEGDNRQLGAKIRYEFVPPR